MLPIFFFVLLARLLVRGNDANLLQLSSGNFQEPVKFVDAQNNILPTRVQILAPSTGQNYILSILDAQTKAVSYSTYTKTGGDGFTTYGTITFGHPTVTAHQEQFVAVGDGCATCAGAAAHAQSTDQFSSRQQQQLLPVVIQPTPAFVNAIIDGRPRVVNQGGSAVTYETYVSTHGSQLVFGMITRQNPLTYTLEPKPLQVVEPTLGPIVSQDFDSYVQRVGKADVTISRYVSTADAGQIRVGLVTMRAPDVVPSVMPQLPIQEPNAGPIVERQQDYYVQIQDGKTRVTVSRTSEVLQPGGATLYRLSRERELIVQTVPPSQIKIESPGAGPIASQEFDAYIQNQQGTMVTYSRYSSTESNGLQRYGTVTQRAPHTITLPARSIVIERPDAGPILEQSFDRYIQQIDGTDITYQRYSTVNQQGQTAVGVTTIRPLMVVTLPPKSIQIESPAAGPVVYKDFDKYVQLQDGTSVTYERYSTSNNGRMTVGVVTQREPVVVKLPQQPFKVKNPEAGPIIEQSFNKYVQLVDGRPITYSRYLKDDASGVTTYGEITVVEPITRTIAPFILPYQTADNNNVVTKTVFIGQPQPAASTVYKYLADDAGNQQNVAGMVTKYAAQQIQLTSTVIVEPFTKLISGYPIEGSRTKVHYYYLHPESNNKVYVEAPSVVQSGGGNNSSSSISSSSYSSSSSSSYRQARSRNFGNLYRYVILQRKKRSISPCSGNCLYTVNGNTDFRQARIIVGGNSLQTQTVVEQLPATTVRLQISSTVVPFTTNLLGVQVTGSRTIFETRPAQGERIPLSQVQLSTVYVLPDSYKNAQPPVSRDAGGNIVVTGADVVPYQFVQRSIVPTSIVTKFVTVTVTAGGATAAATEQPPTESSSTAVFTEQASSTTEQPASSSEAPAAAAAPLMRDAVDSSNALKQSTAATGQVSMFAQPESTSTTKQPSATNIIQPTPSTASVSSNNNNDDLVAQVEKLQSGALGQIFISRSTQVGTDSRLTIASITAFHAPNGGPITGLTERVTVQPTRMPNDEAQQSLLTSTQFVEDFITTTEGAKIKGVRTKLLYYRPLSGRSGVNTAAALQDASSSSPGETAKAEGTTTAQSSTGVAVATTPTEPGREGRQLVDQESVVDSSTTGELTSSTLPTEASASSDSSNTVVETATVSTNAETSDNTTSASLIQPTATVAADQSSPSTQLIATLQNEAPKGSFSVQSFSTVTNGVTVQSTITYYVPQISGPTTIYVNKPQQFVVPTVFNTAGSGGGETINYKPFSYSEVFTTQFNGDTLTGTRVIYSYKRDGAGTFGQQQYATTYAVQQPKTTYTQYFQPFAANELPNAASQGAFSISYSTQTFGFRPAAQTTQYYAMTKYFPDNMPQKLYTDANFVVVQPQQQQTVTSTLYNYNSGNTAPQQGRIEDFTTTIAGIKVVGKRTRYDPTYYSTVYAADYQQQQVQQRQNLGRQARIEQFTTQINGADITGLRTRYDDAGSNAGAGPGTVVNMLPNSNNDQVQVSTGTFYVTRTTKVNNGITTIQAFTNFQPMPGGANSGGQQQHEAATVLLPVNLQTMAQSSGYISAKTTVDVFTSTLPNNGLLTSYRTTYYYQYPATTYVTKYVVNTMPSAGNSQQDNATIAQVNASALQKSAENDTTTQRPTFNDFGMANVNQSQHNLSANTPTDPYNGREHLDPPTYFGNDIVIPPNNTLDVFNTIQPTPVRNILERLQDASNYSRDKPKGPQARSFFDMNGVSTTAATTTSSTIEPNNLAGLYQGREREEPVTYYGNDIVIPHNNSQIVMNSNASNVTLTANQTLKRIINPFGVEFDFLGKLRQQAREFQVLYITVPVTTVTSTIGRDPNRPSYLDRTLAPTDYTIVADNTLVYTSTVGLKTETATLSPMSTKTVPFTVSGGREREIATNTASLSMSQEHEHIDPRRRRRRSVSDSGDVTKEEEADLITADDIPSHHNIAPRARYFVDVGKESENVNDENGDVRNIELQANFLGRTLFDPTILPSATTNNITTTEDPAEKTNTTKSTEHYLATSSSHHGGRAAFPPVEVETGTGVMKVSTTTSSPPVYVLGNKSAPILAENAPASDDQRHQPFALRSIGGDEAVITRPPLNSGGSSLPSLSATNFADDRNALLDYLEGRQFAAAVSGDTFAATSARPHTSRLVTASPAQLLRIQQQNRVHNNDVNNEPRIITAEDFRKRTNASGEIAGVAQSTAPNVTAITTCSEWYIGPNCSINVLILMLAIWLVVLVFGVAVVCCCLYHTPQVVRAAAGANDGDAARCTQQNELAAGAPAGGAWLFTRGSSVDDKNRDGAAFYRQFNDQQPAFQHQQQQLAKTAPPFTIKLPTPDYDDDGFDSDVGQRNGRINNNAGQWPPHHTPFPPPTHNNNTIDYLYYHPTVSTAPNPQQQPAISSSSSAYSAAVIARHQQAMSRHSFVYNPSDCCQSPTPSLNGHQSGAPPPKPPRRPSQNYTSDNAQANNGVDLDPFAHQTQPPLKPKRQLGQSHTVSMTLPAEQRQHYTATTTSTTADEMTTNDDDSENDRRSRYHRQRSNNSGKRVTGSVDELSTNTPRRGGSNARRKNVNATTTTKIDSLKRRASSNNAARDVAYSDGSVDGWTNGHTNQRIVADNLPDVAAVKRHHSFAAGMPLFLPPGARSAADIPSNVLSAATNGAMRLSQTTLADVTTNTVLDDSNVQQIARRRQQQQQNGAFISATSSPHPQQHVLVNRNNALLRSATTVNDAVLRRQQQQQPPGTILYAAAPPVENEPTYVAVDANGMPLHILRRSSFAVGSPPSNNAFVYGMYPPATAQAGYSQPGPMLAIPQQRVYPGGLMAMSPALYAATGGHAPQDRQRRELPSVQ